MLKKTMLKVSMLLTGVALVACVFVSPPVLYPNLAKYAVDDGTDVPFSITVTNSPSSVTCFNGSVTMTTSGSGIYNGTADYSTDLTAHPGTNTVICRATNSAGTTSSTVGFIELIPNIPPTVIMLPTVCVPNNTGSKVFNVAVIDTASSSHLTGSAYSLTQGTLPSGLSINATTGNLTGTPAAGDFFPTALRITAVNAAGSGESADFDINIYQGTCPP